MLDRLLPLWGLVAIAGCAGLLGLDDVVDVGGASAGGSHASGTGGTAGGGGAHDWLSGFDHRRAITLTPSAALTTPLDDFVVPIMLDDDARLRAGAASGSALAFTDSDGVSRLAHELEVFEAATGDLAAWVRLPALPVGGTTLYLYYGGSEPAPNAEVWNPDVFASVWHLADDAAGLPPPILDSAGDNHGAPTTAAAAPSSTSGPVGRALDFDGIDDSIVIGDPFDESLDFNLDSFSLSLWVRQTTTVGNFDMAWSKLGDNRGYRINCGTVWRGELGDGTAVPFLYMGNDADLVGADVHVAMVVDRQAELAHIYVNGVSVWSEPIDTLGSTNTSQPAFISDPIYPFVGVIDEVRVYKRAVTASWVAADYGSVALPGSFTSVGPEQRR
jgi:hypothetical protein